MCGEACGLIAVDQGEDPALREGPGCPTEEAMLEFAELRRKSRAFQAKGTVHQRQACGERPGELGA